MFVRRLFKISDKLKWITLELVIVFIGVYLAFLLQTFNESRKEQKEAEKVYTALKYELEYFRVKLPGMAVYSRNQRRDLRKIYREGNYNFFGNWRFIAPQYQYGIVEYASNLQNNNIVDFQLYDELQDLYNFIQRLEHAESLIMEISQKYQAIPDGLSKSSETYQLRYADNMTNFNRYITFVADRANNLTMVARSAQRCLDVINPRLDAKKRKEIEAALIRQEIRDFGTIEEAVPEGLRMFPDFTEEEMKALYEQGPVR